MSEYADDLLPLRHELLAAEHERLAETRWESEHPQSDFMAELCERFETVCDGVFETWADEEKCPGSLRPRLRDEALTEFSSGTGWTFMENAPSRSRTTVDVVRDTFDRLARMIESGEKDSLPG